MKKERNLHEICTMQQFTPRAQQVFFCTISRGGKRRLMGSQTFLRCCELRGLYFPPSGAGQWVWRSHILHKFLKLPASPGDGGTSRRCPILTSKGDPRLEFSRRKEPGIRLLVTPQRFSTQGGSSCVPVNQNMRQSQNILHKRIVQE